MFFPIPRRFGVARVAIADSNRARFVGRPAVVPIPDAPASPVGSTNPSSVTM